MGKTDRVMYQIFYAEHYKDEWISEYRKSSRDRRKPGAAHKAYWNMLKDAGEDLAKYIDRVMQNSKISTADPAKLSEEEAWKQVVDWAEVVGFIAHWATNSAKTSLKRNYGDCCGEELVKKRYEPYDGIYPDITRRKLEKLQDCYIELENAKTNKEKYNALKRTIHVLREPGVRLTPWTHRKVVAARHKVAKKLKEWRKKLS